MVQREWVEKDFYKELGVSSDASDSEIKSVARKLMAENHPDRNPNNPVAEERYKAGPRAMPLLVPTRPDDPASDANRQAWAVLTRSDIPFLCPFSDGDPITAAMAPILKRDMPGAVGRTHPTIAGAGHFLQEDAGPELAAVVAEFVRGEG